MFTSELNSFAIYWLSSVRSSLKSGFVTLGLDLAYAGDELGVSTGSCWLMPLAVGMWDDSDWLELRPLYKEVPA